MADTEHDIEIKHNLDEYAQKIKESNDLWDAHYLKVKAVGDELTKNFAKSLKDSVGPMQRIESSFTNMHRMNMQSTQYSQRLTRDLTTLFNSMRGTGGIFNVGVLQGTIGLMSTAARGGAGARIGTGAATTATTGTAEEVGALVGAAAGTSFITKILGSIGTVAKIGITLATTEYVTAQRGAARGRQASGLGGTVGGISAAELGFERYVDVDPALQNITKGLTDFTSPQYLALKLAGLTKGMTDKTTPEELLGRAQVEFAKESRGWAREKLDPLSQSRGWDELLSPSDRLRLWQKAQEGPSGISELEAAAKKAELDKKSYDLTKDQVRMNQNIVQTTKEWATTGETQSEAFPTKGIIDMASAIWTSLKESHITIDLPKFGQELKDATERAKEFLKEYGPQNLPTMDAQPFSAMTPYSGGGFKIPGVPKGSATDPLYVKPVAALTGIDDGITGGGGAYFPSFAAPSYGAGPSNLYGPGGTLLPSSVRPESGRVSVDTIAQGNRIAKNLMKDYGLTKEQAIGAVGVMGYESADFKQLQEQNPWGGRGGWGWAQWTGPRRLDFEKTTAGMDPKSYEANYKMIQHELADTPWGKALTELKKTKTVKDAADAWLRYYEGMVPGGPGVPAYAQHEAKALKYEKSLLKDDAAQEAKTANAVKKASGWEGATDTPNAGVRIYDPTTGRQIYPSPTEQGPGGKQSMNDMRLYQQERGTHIKISNPAGATVNTQTAMLGAIKGGFA
jgi:Phage tail lysozyme